MYAITPESDGGGEIVAELSDIIADVSVTDGQPRLVDAHGHDEPPMPLEVCLCRYSLLTAFGVENVLVGTYIPR